MKAKNFYLLICLVTGAGLFYSCQKNLSEESGVLPARSTTTIISADSSYLDKVLYVQSNGGLEDTVAVDQYIYDASKRVTSVVYHDLSAGSTGADTYSKLYAYTGNDTLPAMETMPDPVTTDTTRTFFFYAGTQRIRDSVLKSYHYTALGVSYRQLIKTIKNYGYYSNKITGRESGVVLADNNPSGQTGYTFGYRDTAITDAAGNILSFRNWNDNTNSIEYNGTYSYDNKINPFSRVSNFKSIDIFPGSETFIDEMQAVNNRLQAHESFGGTPTFSEDLTGDYTYRLNGFPKEIIEPSSPGTLKIIFLYKAL